MFKALLLASMSIGLAAMSTAASARTEPQAAGGQTPATQDQQGVLVFRPDFFAEQRPNTALDMVNRVPGFRLDDGSGARGFEGAVGNILINGARPASKSDTGSAVLSRTLPAQVDRIELIRGGAPGVDMQGYSEVVNVVLKRQSSLQQVVQWDGLLFENGHDVFGGRYQVTKRDGDRSMSLTLADGLSSSDSGGPGHVIRRNPSGAITRDELSLSNQFGGGASIRANYTGPVLGGKIDLTARYGVNDWHDDQTQQSAIANRFNLFEYDSGSGEVGVVYERPLSASWKGEGRFIHQFNTTDGTSLARTTLGGVTQPEQVFLFDDRSSETILRGLVRNERSQTLTVEMGAEAAYNMLDTDQSFTVGGAPVVLPSATVKVEELRGEAFAKSTWRATPTLSLETGIRFETSTISQSGDASNEETFFFAKPRVLATWTPAPNNQLRLRLEREVGQLNFDDFAASSELQNDQVFGGNVNLSPEQRWIAELIYERRFWKEGVFTVTLRHDEISDAIDRIPLPGGLSATGNIGDATSDFAEVSFTLPTQNLGVPGGRLRSTTTWQKSSVTDPTTGQDRRLSRQRPFDTGLFFTQDLSGGRYQWGFDWLHGFDEPVFDPDFRAEVKFRSYRSLFAEWKPTPTLSLRGAVTNLDQVLVTRTVYADRSSQAVAFIEERETNPRVYYSLRLRKTF